MSYKEEQAVHIRFLSHHAAEALSRIESAIAHCKDDEDDGLMLYHEKRNAVMLVSIQLESLLNRYAGQDGKYDGKILNLIKDI